MRFFENFFHFYFYLLRIIIIGGENETMDELVKEIEEMNQDEALRLKLEAKKRYEVEQNAIINGYLKKGEKKASLKIAKNLKDSGMSDEEISSITELPVEEIKQL